MTTTRPSCVLPLEHVCVSLASPPAPPRRVFGSPTACACYYYIIIMSNCANWYIRRIVSESVVVRVPPALGVLWEDPTIVKNLIYTYKPLYSSVIYYQTMWKKEKMYWCVRRSPRNTRKASFKTSPFYDVLNTHESITWMLIIEPNDDRSTSIINWFGNPFSRVCSATRTDDHCMLYYTKSTKRHLTTYYNNCLLSACILHVCASFV